jgi:hypothetical protein
MTHCNNPAGEALLTFLTVSPLVNDPSLHCVVSDSTRLRAAGRMDRRASGRHRERRPFARYLGQPSCGTL